jgi:hypothetical protein
LRENVGLINSNKANTSKTIDFAFACESNGIYCSPISPLQLYKNVVSTAYINIAIPINREVSINITSKSFKGKQIK